ncbi:ABC transporter permease [Phytomonospora endophytica]|uniref:ABC-type dipeptide/oligopeptide/nickel transport system permease component n=1 Tax=Phytomonospora endophytica TaxID=714109 RepID=A0A841FE10_9ACTN|nr:ABC transporter permease [Phytomonospora endophytica]MBB6033253.1 ABC-type dipeptide/oligopeptide/nickel transport system permease component [Phytomonospora endophytica]GIG65479.1 putative dipeptide-transport integral membrane protein ABC transporter DppB [Phytomonospora endophytica]
MGRYVIRRLLQAVLTFGVVMFLLHYLMSLAIQINGNPVRTFFGDKPVSPELLAATKAKFGLDDPCLSRVGDPCLNLFGKRMSDWASFDFGTNFNRADVSELILNAIPKTLQLFLIVTIVWVLFGITAGVLAAMRRGRFLDYLVRIGTTLTIAIPGFLLLILTQKIIGVWLGNWAREEFGRDSVLGIMFQPSYNARYPWLTLLVPGIVLGIFGIAGITRLSRTSMLENLRADFVRTAKAKGLRQRRVTIVHTLRNSLIPVITLIGFTLADALGGSVITEGIYGIPGMGKLAYDAVKKVDTPVIIAVTAILSVSYMLVNLLIDLLYAVLDPRIRYE